MTDDATEEYRRCKLIARKVGNTFKGKAWRGSQELGIAEAGSTGAVIERLRAMVDERFVVEMERNSVPYPSAESYRKAFMSAQQQFPDAYVAMLRAHYAAPGQTLTARQLAQAAGYKDWQSANLHYGTLGKILGEELLFQPHLRPGTKDPVWTSMLAMGIAEEETAPEAEYRWKMRKEVALALEQIGIVTKHR